MEQLSLGLMSRSRKPDERRLPIHPAHFERIDPDIRDLMSVEAAMASRSASPTSDCALGGQCGDSRRS